jgi:DsbC/DsbD-like thiol-disulfide interchange protein
MKLLPLKIAFAAMAAAQNPIQWTLTGAPVKPGTTAAARLKATIEPGWHLYGLTQPPDGPKATTIWVSEGQPFRATGDVKAPKPLREHDQNFGVTVEFYEREVTFGIPVRREGSESAALHVNVRYQTCNDKLCLPPKTVSVSATQPAAR